MLSQAPSMRLRRWTVTPLRSPPAPRRPCWWLTGKGPDITNVTPRHGTLQSGNRINIGFTVSDSGSGLRTDSEDGVAANGGADSDGNSDEPLSSGVTGASTDIHMTWGEADDMTPSETEERRGDRNWVEEEKNQSYSTSFTIGVTNSAIYEWGITATDRAGNTTVFRRQEQQLESSGQVHGPGRQR